MVALHSKTGLLKDLREQAQFDVMARIKLNALNCTLSHFNIMEEDRPVFGEGILRFERIAKSRLTIKPADDKMQKFCEMFNFYRRAF